MGRKAHVNRVSRVVRPRAAVVLRYFCPALPNVSERQLRELKRKKTNPGAGAVSKSNAYTVAEDQ